MVQRKNCQTIKSYNFQPETQFEQEHIKILGPEMMMMKRTKSRRKLKDNSVSQSGKPQAPPKHDLVVKVTSGSPNYMKDTTSSEARKENKKRFNLSRNQKNQACLKHDSRNGVNKERSNNKPSSKISRGLIKSQSFKRCSQRATCSSTLKDSKFPDYLMLYHGETDDEVNGTSVLKVCPYSYCSLNDHLHSVQYPPLKSFISSRRLSLKSQKIVKMEVYKEDFVDMCVDEKKESFEIDIITQVSESVSEGAPWSETDSDDYSDSAEMVKFSESDHGSELKESDLKEILVNDSVKEIQESYEVDAVTQISETLTEGAFGSQTDSDDYSDTADGDVNQSGCFSSEVICTIKNSAVDNASEDGVGEETLKDKAEECKEKTQDRSEVVIFNLTRRPCNLEQEREANTSWTILKRKKTAAETEDLREFNPREPNYLPIVLDADTEKVNLKHQDNDEKKNSEDWMFDYALQRAVTKLSSARKRKVALLVEAFETAQPIMPHSSEPPPVLSYGRHLQVCN